MRAARMTRVCQMQLDSRQEKVYPQICIDEQVLQVWNNRCSNKKRGNDEIPKICVSDLLILRGVSCCACLIEKKLVSSGKYENRQITNVKIPQRKRLCDKINYTAYR